MGDFAVLDTASSGKLRSCQGFPLRYEAVIRANASNRSGVDRSSVISISINIIGPELIAEVIGDKLSQSDAYLQHPWCLDAGIPYMNPHYFSPQGRVDLTHMIAVIGNEVQRRDRNYLAILLDSFSAVPPAATSTQHEPSVSDAAITKLKRYVLAFQSQSDQLA